MSTVRKDEAPLCEEPSSFRSDLLWCRLFWYQKANLKCEKKNWARKQQLWMIYSLHTFVVESSPDTRQPGRVKVPEFFVIAVPTIVTGTEIVFHHSRMLWNDASQQGELGHIDKVNSIRCICGAIIFPGVIVRALICLNAAVPSQERRRSRFVGSCRK